MNKLILLIFAVIFSIGFVSATYNSTLFLQGTGELLEDTYVYKDQATTNYDDNNLTLRFNDLNEIYYPYFTFNLSSLDDVTGISYSSVEIVNITFGIYSWQDSWGEPALKTGIHHVYNNTWTEDTLTYNNQPCVTSANNFNNDTNCNLTAGGHLTGTAVGWRLGYIKGIFENNRALGETTLSIGLDSYSQTGASAFLCYDKESSSTNSSYLNITYSSDYLANAISFSSPTFDTQRETFEINLSYDNNVYNSVSTSLVYNGTSYLGTSSSSVGNNIIFFTTVDIPVVTTQQNHSFYWELSFTNNTGTTLFNSSINNQIVNPTNFSQCGSTEVAVNYTTYKESDGLLLTTDFDATFIWKINSSSLITKNISMNLTGANNYQFCINLNQTFFTDATIDLGASGYTSRIYELFNQNYNNATTEQFLYLLNSSAGTNIIIEVKDQGLIPLEGYTVKIFRYVADQGGYIAVEEDTTDLFGQIVARLVENTVRYRFEFYDADSVLVQSTGDVTIACRATICILPFIIEDTEDDFERFDNATDLTYGLTFNNNTNIFSYTWNDNTGDASPSFRLEVKRRLFNGTTTVCNITSTSLSDSLTCNVGSMKASYQAQAFRTVGEDEDRIAVMDAKVGDITDTFGLEGLIISFILLFTLVIVGVFNPVIGIVLYLIGFLSLGFIGVIYAPPLVIIAQIIIGGFLIWALRT